MKALRNNMTFCRHCEERSDVAIHNKPTSWIASSFLLAMTWYVYIVILIRNISYAETKPETLTLIIKH
jgi:hypothetical protein